MRSLKLSLLLLFTLLIACLSFPLFTSKAQEITPLSSQEYTLLAWNDLGMHCISPSFDKIAILPPFNNLYAQVILRGNPPKVVTSGLRVEYFFKKNTTTVGKTNFWKYVKPLFGVDLSEGVGLTGNKLSGKMLLVGDHFEAIGIPLLPYDDSMKWNPYQKATVKLLDSAGNILATVNPIAPVSDELHCDKCHDRGGVAAIGINTGSIEGNILALHDRNLGTQLSASQPVLCANCHASNALNMKGNPQLPSLSLAMHGKHSSLSASQGMPGCYDCHPGPKTNCYRTGLEGMSPRGTNPNCQSCHGELSQVANSIRQGREPWLQEPSCAQCHERQFSTGTTLFRNSRTHGGVFCSACHNSPHAWWPSLNKADNLLPIKVQGVNGPIGRNCQACHTNSPKGDSPHEGDD